MIKINGFENYYITKEGQIYNSRREKNQCTWKDNVGYLQTALYKDGKRHYFRIHRLVAEYFLEPIEGKPMVNHKDGNKLNNNVNNLEWSSNRENTQHGYDNGLYRTRKRRHEIEVFDKQWNYIRTYSSIRSLSEDLNLNRKTITSILKNEKNNNYDYNFRYKQEGQSTTQSVA